MPKGKGKTPLTPPEPAATAQQPVQAPDPPKPPDDMANPYREQHPEP
jgi:hypothetical protein